MNLISFNPAIFKRTDFLFGALVIATFFGVILFRPPFPVDETRYLTVAWEMYLKKEWFLLSYNFEPYHHKPPMLFWLINIFWSIFGVSRWAAAIPVMIASAAVIFLTGRLAAILFPGDDNIKIRARLMLIGSLPFLIYGSLMMFDIMICAFALAAILCLFKFAQTRNWMAFIGYGVFMGLGVLTKGPVLLMYAFLPALFAPLWVPKSWGVKWVMWYSALLGALIIAFLVTVKWLIPLAQDAGDDFFHWLLWKQTADRITGNGFDNIHPRPFWFYLKVLPLFMAPWLFFPSLWRNIFKNRGEFKLNMGLRFLAVWLGAAFLIFSLLISGKQPHYLAPLIPGLFILMAYFTRNVSIKAVKRTVLGMVAFFVVAHAAAMNTIIPRYDYREIGAFIQANHDRDWAFVRNYNGEVGFLGRMEKSLYSTDIHGAKEWFKTHPDGYAVIRYKKPEHVADLVALVPPRPFRGAGYVGVFTAKKPE
jgi:4-amino-4-deoxy-L-arabinose transferase-like glycosyltransferase